MDILLDTNIFVGYFDRDDERFETTNSCIRELIKAEHRLIYTPQIEAEFISVATRDRTVNGFGLTPQAAEEHLDEMETTFTLRYSDPSARRAAFRALFRELNITGRRIHDLQLVADAKALTVQRKVSCTAGFQPA